MRAAQLALSLLVGTATAQEWEPMPGVDCYCTDGAGARVEFGAEACLTVGGRSYVALCGMSQNVMAWRDTGRGCPTG